MDRYTKGFVVASLVYYFAAAVLGIWMGGTDGAGWVRFAHVHFNLLGFMAMMIYGVGYFILPRFNGRTLRWPSLVPIHFYIANIGLIGMVATAPERPSTGFILFSALSVLSTGMFAVNLGATMLMEPKAAAEEEEPASAAEVSSAESLRYGGRGDAAPAPGRGAFRTAARGAEDRPRHARGRDPQPVAANGGRLRGARLRLPCEPGAPRAGEADPDHATDGVPAAQRGPRIHGGGAERSYCALLRGGSRTFCDSLRRYGGRARRQAKAKSPKGKLSRGETIGENHILGEILAAYPETEKVFRKYYGDGCFSCPGQATESVKQSAMMHNVSEKQLLSELNQAADH